MKINKIKSKIPPSHPFQVVGIGASAGGLEAFKRFIKAIPQNSGMAYVLVQHLDPGHQSLLPVLLQKITTIPVLEILEDIKVKPDHIYVIPNNKMIIAGEGILKLIPRLSNNEHGNLPINTFFTSLGEVYKSNAIGVVLSGNGSDGTSGLRAIKDNQGITLSQDKESAAYKGMPDSAAQSGVVDFILPPENIPQKILELTKSLCRNNAKNKNIVKERNSILTGVETNTHFNFSKTSPVINTQTPDFQKMADHILLSKYSPTGIVVTEAMDIVYFRGHTANYLEQAPGKPSHNLLKMAKEGLAFELLNILNKVKKENAPVATENFPFLANGRQVNIDIEAIPLPNMKDAHYLILFQDKNATLNKRMAGSNKKIRVKKKINNDLVRIQFLEHEMLQNREDMRIITEDLEAANEELQNANEELQSGSEELLSLNDALEASKEELQNNNEALTSLNRELIGLNEQVTAARNYTESIIDTVWEPLLVLDKDFRIKSANNSFYKKFRANKKQTEGVLIYDLGNKQWDIPKLHILLEEILPQNTRFTDYKVTQIFAGIGERTMQLNACEIIREKKEEKLILLSIQDITENEQLQIKEKEFQKELEEKVKRRTFELQEANEELQQKNQEIALSKYNKRFIAEFTEKFSAYTTNNEFFNSLVQFIADTTRLDYVFVGIPGQTGNKQPIVQTIALSAFGKLIENINYPLGGSPCEQVMLGTDYSFPENCRQTFPKSKIIRRFSVAGYLGYPLKDDRGNSVGFIAVMHEKKIEDTETVSAVLKIVARRAEIELERIKHGKELVFQNAEKEKRSAELITANKELVFQNYEKEKRAAELIIANRELAFQNEEKEKRASELIIANKELAFQNEEKEKRASELIIANKELAFQNEEKERRAVELNIANKELESFAYISSHDLQEPLRKIQTFANRILEKEYAVLSDKGKDYFNRMHSASKRMRTLIEDLLAYSRTNITERKFEKTDLNKIIAEAKNEFAEALLEKNAVIETGKLNEAGINSFQFLQVMNNLIGNALKFSKAGSPLRIKIKSKIAKGIHFQNENLAIRAGQLSPKKYYCHISVTDNGIGFDPQYKDKIFEVFQRLHVNEGYEGTGIGLAIVKKIVEHHHGIVTASSEIGKGSTFDIYVPD